MQGKSKPQPTAVFLLIMPYLVKFTMYLKQHLLPPTMLESLLLLKVLFLCLLNSSFRGVEITHEGESIQLVNPFEIVAKDAVPMEVRLFSL